MNYTSDSESDGYNFFKELSIYDILKKRSTKRKVFHINSFNVTSDSDVSTDGTGGYKMDIVKTFINKIKRNPKFKMNFKNYTLKEIKPHSKDIIMATIVDLNYIKKHLKAEDISESSLKDYITNGDFIPLIYGNTDNKNIVYLKQINSKGKKKIVRNKKTIFSDNSRPIIFTIKVSNNLKFFNPVKKDTEDSIIESIENKAVVEYSIGRNFMLIPNPKENVKVKTIETVLFRDGKYEIVPYKTSNIEFQKMTIEEFENLLGTLVKKLTKFE